MDKQNRKKKLVAGYVRSRLTLEELERVKQRADASGMSVSEWVRGALVAGLAKSPGERRLMEFFAAQSLAIRLSLDEWQGGEKLSDPDVQKRIMERSIEGAREYMASVNWGIN